MVLRFIGPLQNISKNSKMPKSIKQIASEDDGKNSPHREVDVELKGKSGVVTTKSLDIKTLEDALRVSKVDLKTWEVERHVINSWEVTIGAKNANSEQPETYTNYQVKVWLKRLTPTVVEVVLQNLLKRFEAAARPAPAVRPAFNRAEDRHLLEIALHDVHFGLLAWGQETGEDYDLKIARSRYSAAVQDLLEKTKGFPPEKILLPIGHDFFHVNNPEGYTPASHHHLTMDGRLAKVVTAGFEAVINAVETCISVAPVEVLWVPGNHDPETSWFLCQMIKAYFRLNPNVSVDVGPQSRKYRRYGVNLIGFTHGNEEKFGDLPTLMASERKEDWSHATCYEWHLGHYHKKKEMRFNAGDTFGNVRVRIIPSLCGTDAWHFRKGYVKGCRVAEAFAYSFSEGLIGEFTSRDLRHIGHKN